MAMGDERKKWPPLPVDQCEAEIGGYENNAVPKVKLVASSNDKNANYEESEWLRPSTNIF